MSALKKTGHDQRADSRIDRGALEPASVCGPAGGSGEVAQLVRSGALGGIFVQRAAVEFHRGDEE